MKIVQALNDKELQDAYTVRHHVFVEGQGVPAELERDDLDVEAHHFVGYLDNKPVAAGRVRIVDHYGKFERICVLEAYRGKSLGKELMLAIEEALVAKDIRRAKLNAQTHAESFYQALGYQTISNTFLDAGMPHVTMEKKLIAKTS
ncbi:N-acetyltransferase [Paraliobacillus quinghaiensis]|uniref:N-acetyltransferase n=1 Tax=Paraliobacillus quinghaiensis TaxID=470815 RepID=A0A917TIE4_9BACI|nr:GNAT family N-acetyltransferase [Paraliobacillus quinghaiensis]GGM24612.1 N-acetyltransferase [Paraliobacillus quinghaiensis]